MQNIEKECGICGKFFSTSNPHRKYCDDCTEHSTAKKRQMARAYAASRRRMGESEVFEVTCSTCGRKMMSTASYLIAARDADNERHVFCSERCKNEWKEEHAVCAYCGKKLKGTGRYNPRNSYEQYCSEECKENAKWQKARKNGTVRKCLRCGKEFVRSSGTFCSNECYKAALNDGWRARAMSGLNSEKQITRKEVCTYCGKHYQRTYKGNLPTQTYTFCSDECLKEFREKAVERATGKMLSHKVSEHIHIRKKVSK